ncbi:MAG: hypothetical protein ACOZE5_18120 [Verrucomicrobiota bacterium]
MKSRHCLLAGLAALAFAATAIAQNNPQAPSKPPAKSERELRVEAKLEALAQPPAIAISADGEAGPVVTDSATWRMEQAQKLLRVGMRLKEKGETALAADAAAKALALLDGAAGMIDAAKQPALAAQRNEIAGMVHERLTGNTVQARLNYEAAKQSSTGSAKLAESRLKRLDRAEGRPETPANSEPAKDGKPEKPKG